MQGGAEMGRGGYETRMVLVTSLAISFVAFDRLATGYLGPYLVANLGLSNLQLGMVYSIQAIAVAVVGFVVARLSDRSGRRIALLVPILLLAALCAAGIMMARSFAMLLLIRLASGAALGGISPITQSIVAAQSAPARIGRNIGIQTLLMFLVSQMVGPLILPRIAERWGWQAGFAASAVPLAMLAVAVPLMLRETGRSDAAASHNAVTTPSPVAPRLDAAGRRTVLLCTCISGCFMIWLVVHSTFLAAFLVRSRGLTPTESGGILGTLGVAGAIGGLALPVLSDRFGRRAVLISGLLLAMLVPVSAVYFAHNMVLLQIGLFVGWMAVGVLPIYAVLMPGDMVPPARMAATVAIVTGTGEIVGGVVGPVIAGKLADAVSLTAPFWFAFALAGVGVVLAALLPKHDGAVAAR